MTNIFYLIGTTIALINILLYNFSTHGKKFVFIPYSIYIPDWAWTFLSKSNFYYISK